MVTRDQMLSKYLFKTLVFNAFNYKIQDRQDRFIPEFLSAMETVVTVEKDSDENIVLIRPDASYIIVNQVLSSSL